MFSKILHANDGSVPAFRAFALAVDIAKQNTAALHMVCVEEIPYLPEFIEEVREETGVAARRFHSPRDGGTARGEASNPCAGRSPGANHRRSGERTGRRSSSHRCYRSFPTIRTHDRQSGRQTRTLGVLPCFGRQVTSPPTRR